MIPVRLELKNFLAYRSPDALYFEGIHLACLVGENGAGKSSLLDAITWALWGRARAKRDDDLVHLGQGDMYVQLDFEQEGLMYRVVRQRKAGKRGVGTLDLFVVQQNGDLLTMNEPNMRQTQTKIDSILRLDYETFVNSAFLQQGKADAFTVKNPAERKRILGEILGLDAWRVYEDRVKRQLKTIRTELSNFDGRLQEIQAELAKEPQYLREKQQAEEAYAQAEQALNAAEVLLAEVADADSNLRNAESQRATHAHRKQTHENDLGTVKTQMTQRREAIAQYETIIATAEQIEAGYAALQEARDRESELGKKLSQLTDVNARYGNLEKQLRDAQAALENQQSELEGTIAVLKGQINGAYETELADVQAQIAEMEGFEKQREALSETISQLKQDDSGLKSMLKTLANEGKKLNERIDRLGTSDSDVCPLCGQPLDEVHREQVLDELTTDRDTMREQYKEANQRIQSIGDEVKDHDAQIQALGDKIAVLPRLRQQAGTLQAQATQAQDAQVRLTKSQAELDIVQKALAEGDYGHDLRIQLQQLDEERNTIGYDTDEYEAVSTQRAEFSSYEQQHLQLQVARSALPTEQTALDNLLARQEQLEKAIADEDADLKRLDEEIKALSVQVAVKNQRREEVLKQRALFNAASGKLGSANQQLAALEQLRARRATIEEQREQAEQQQALYKELEYAFGKNGVPTMIIEAAIPELETAANELLGRMTDGRMHLRLSTLTTNVDGSQRETLEIEIADELGTRPYEMYSGGEAFRINFAIRVALSKMLARRAGAHLRTLFIDEGFGTQDDQGRNKLVEAITAIQDDFDLVLVITHIDELRDAFPVHVIVEKTNSGSMISVR
ncbi:SMC family ATPase [Phototrophicus methaneseepsis]|uniref:Nuclease SbcCD subunit C n=1 Tax=Phototrophicus methaneseepsis TaxID=2710758 RepID=A0A7S8IDN5_9CHLR|nr:SMC family ATPase [Phototrophicus methaneseepsis]QPC82815.1 SMC family ATPase [Phototrophicus methaneseepsis]